MLKCALALGFVGVVSVSTGSQDRRALRTPNAGRRQFDSRAS
jgi:hypothetical protein